MDHGVTCFSSFITGATVGCFIYSFCQNDQYDLIPPKAQKQIISALYCELLIYFSKEPNLVKNPLKLAPMSTMLLPKLKVVCHPLSGSTPE